MNFQMKKSIKLSIIFLFASVAIFGFASVLQAQYYNNYNSCNAHAYKDCVGSAIYWFDSCSNRQDLYQDCLGYGQTCKYGQCVNYVPVVPPTPVYVAHSKIACYGNSLYWYDSLGSASGLYKTCQDANSCTLDACKSGRCSNVLKCDGTTCSQGSADYNTYCALPQTPQIPQTPSENVNLAISFVAKIKSSAEQWDKSVQVSQNSNIYFMISVNNNSGSQINNVNISANIPTEISFLGNLKVNDSSVGGDIVSGINIGSLPAGVSKSITFEGRTQTFSTKGQKSAVVTTSISGTNKTDSLTLNFSSSQVAQSASLSSAPSGFVKFLQRWYLWILVAIVLVFLFVVVFRRLSSGG